MNTNIDRTRRLGLAGLGVGALALTACDVIDRLSKQEQFKSIDVTGANWGKGFSLADTDGKQRSLADFQGKIVSLFFGFLNCPDFCPSHLARQVEVLRLMGDQASKIQTVFISVDPERDTPEAIKKYLTAFHPSFLGLTGTVEQVKETSKEFKAFFQRVDLKGSAAGYAVDHTTNTTVFDTKGAMRLMMRHELSAADVAQDFKLLLKKG